MARSVRAAPQPFRAAAYEERLSGISVKPDSEGQSHETNLSAEPPAAIAFSGARIGFSSTHCASTAASSMNPPPAMTAVTRLPPSKFFTSGPKVIEARISGSTMKKLNIPMYTPIRLAGNAPARIA